MKTQKIKVQKIKVKLKGIKPIIFNRFTSLEDKDVPVEKKIQIEDGKVVIGSDRIMNFLTSNNPKYPPGCIKLFTDTKKYKQLLPKTDAYIGIEPYIIPIRKDDKYKVREDKVGGGGLPQMIKRPTVENWELEFQINLIDNTYITFGKLKGLFERGGIEVGMGAWRPRYGQFVVEEFKKIK